MANVHFVTGFPGFIGKRFVAALLQRERKGRVVLLVQSRFAREAKQLVGRYEPKIRSRVEILQGDVADMHLGLSGEEYRGLAADVTHIFHLAAITHLGVDPHTLQRVNVEGSRNILELGRDARKLQRLCHMSTVHVAGDREGVIDEGELEEGQRFHNAYEETKFRAEVLVRKAMGELPISVFRPSTVVGDSRTGEIDRFDGPYYLAFQLVTSPLRVALPLPGDGSFPLNVVPSDYVVEAMLSLAFNPEAVGRTFHLVDPNPMSARKVYEHVARRAGKKPPRLGIPARASAALLKLPLFEKLARPQRAAIEHLNQLVIYNCRNTLELLDGTQIRCPPLDTYLDRLLDYVEEQNRKRRAARQASELAAEDPLAPTPEAPSEEGPAEESAPVVSGGEATRRRRQSAKGAARVPRQAAKRVGEGERVGAEEGGAKDETARDPAEAAANAPSADTSGDGGVKRASRPRATSGRGGSTRHAAARSRGAAKAGTRPGRADAAAPPVSEEPEAADEAAASD